LVDQATSTARDTAAFARRVVLRTLTVVGGAAAGTAIAWCLSTAGAAADTGAAANPGTPEVPVVSTIVSPVSAGLDAVADRIQDPPPADTVEQLGKRVKQAAGDFGQHATEQLPECADPLCGLEHVGRGEAPAPGDGAGLGRSDSPSPAPAAALPAAAGQVAGPGVDPDRTAESTATGRAYSDGMSRRGSPAPGVPSFPDFPSWPAPVAPAPPTAPGHNGSAGNPADSSLFAALPWQDRTPALVRGLTVPATEVVTTGGRVGAQPGVTPD
jgi:hypothetical protein